MVVTTDVVLVCSDMMCSFVTVLWYVDFVLTQNNQVHVHTVDSFPFQSTTAFLSKVYYSSITEIHSS